MTVASWRVNDHVDAGASVELLLEAGTVVDEGLVPKVMASGGLTRCVTCSRKDCRGLTLRHIPGLSRQSSDA